MYCKNLPAYPNEQPGDTLPLVRALFGSPFNFLSRMPFAIMNAVAGLNQKSTS